MRVRNIIVTVGETPHHRQVYKLHNEDTGMEIAAPVLTIRPGQVLNLIIYAPDFPLYLTSDEGKIDEGGVSTGSVVLDYDQLKNIDKPIFYGCSSQPYMGNRVLIIK